jgi:hypothetical protein
MGGGGGCDEIWSGFTYWIVLIFIVLVILSLTGMWDVPADMTHMPAIDISVKIIFYR